MAEGFLQNGSSEKQAEDIGEDFFEDLYSRSFFQQYSGLTSGFVMHDLINDLAQWAAEDFCFRVENAYAGEKQLNMPKYLRTFLPILPVPRAHCSTYDILNMLPQLQRLRVLSLKRFSVSELPNTISDLKHLRYLDLSYSEIENLPDTVNTLYNLETLILKECSRLKNLCSDVGNLINLRHLYISYFFLFERMPSRIGQLTCLQTWPCYFVGKDVGFRLKELKNLTHLRNSFHISRLENVNDVEDAYEADLIGKKNLRELELEWTSTVGAPRNVEMETQVLDMLQPCEKLEKLTIRSYGGTKFPSWLGNTSFSSLMLLRFEGCVNCTSLPPIGHLPLLKDLFIKQLVGISSIGPEFYGNGCSTPFQSLQNLHIEDMQEWKDWSHLRFGRDNVVFPHLQRLSIEDCPKLIGHLPEHLPSLESLCIRRCEQLQMLMPTLPKHCIVEMFKYKEVLSSVDCSSLNKVVSSDISGGVFLAERFLQGSSTVVRTEIVGYIKKICFWQFGADSLEDIDYGSLGLEFRALMSFMEEESKEVEQRLACRLQYLALRNCESLLKLPQVLHSFSFLRGLSIQDCPKLVSIPEAALPSELRFVVIKECNALEFLPELWMQTSNTSLEVLSIQHCDSLTCIARVQLPPNLKKLEVLYCSGLKTLVDVEEVSLTQVENVSIGSCSKIFAVDSSKIIASQSRGNLPKALKHLYVLGCSKLESIAESFHDNTSLETLEIHHCENLKLLANDLDNLNHLQKCSISGCKVLYHL